MCFEWTNHNYRSSYASGLTGAPVRLLKWQKNVVAWSKYFVLLDLSINDCRLNNQSDPFWHTRSIIWELSVSGFPFLSSHVTEWSLSEYPKSRRHPNRSLRLLGRQISIPGDQVPVISTAPPYTYAQCAKTWRREVNNSRNKTVIKFVFESVQKL